MSTGTSIAAWRGGSASHFQKRATVDSQLIKRRRLWLLCVVHHHLCPEIESLEFLPWKDCSFTKPNESAVASYNVACCYSKLNQVQAGLSALEDALKGGFEDFKRIRTDPDLAKIRISEDIEKVMKKFDEAFISENAIDAIKSIFGISIKQ
ncbi:unnamed protein product [Fraxinus pennsylvanica]|uniref:Uncharacterized protein n=1 Tax=Fraxinus pennsylvanica TaxID=56036 RepID=A0AAD1ZF32_9LAMI|nr:unnamed protein product [Fraxinus pennsylvanica]